MAVFYPVRLIHLIRQKSHFEKKILSQFIRTFTFPLLLLHVCSFNLNKKSCLHAKLNFSESNVKFPKIDEVSA